MDLEWDPDQPGILVVGWGSAEEEAHAAVPGNVPASVWEQLADHRRPIIQFTKADAKRLLENGRSASGPIFDLQTAAWVLDENQPLDLESLAHRYCRIRMDKRLIRRGGTVWFICDDKRIVPISQAPLAELRAYCRRDVGTEGELAGELIQQLEDEGWLEYFIEEEIPYTRVLIDMELAGMPINLEKSEELRGELEFEHDQLKGELSKDLPAAFNVDSDDDVAAYLFKKTFTVEGKYRRGEKMPLGFVVDEEKRVWTYGHWRVQGLGLPRGQLTPKCEKGECMHADWREHKPSVSRPALLLNPDVRKHPWVVTYLAYSKLHKLLTTYLRVFPEVARNGRIHCEFNQTGTVTGRLSSRNINMQNIPARGEMGKKVRGLFEVPKGGHPLLMGDHSQLESRLMAHYSQDPFLLKCFREGRDLFLEMGQLIYGHEIDPKGEERDRTKRIWYAQGYGAQEEKISDVLTVEGLITSIDEADELLTEMGRIVPVYFEWREDLIEEAHELGYVETIGGRRRRIRFDKKMSWKVSAHGERAVANAKIQGSAADVVRRLMLRFRRPALRLLLQIHDELVYQYLQRVAAAQIQEDIRQLQYVAEKGHGYEISVPLVFEPKVAMSWAEKG